MNISLQNKLYETASSNNVAYILNDNNDFSVTGYKVMENQSNSCLLPCAKLMYNGQIKLVYLVGNYKPLSVVVTRLGVSELNAVIFNLIQRAMEIKANGFFKAESLELDFDKIFVDTSDYSVHMIYFPVSAGNTGKISSFESEFRVALINLFNSYPVFNAPQFQRLCVDLSNGSLPLNQVLKKLQDNINGVNSFNSRIDDPAKFHNVPDYPSGNNPVGSVYKGNEFNNGGDYQVPFTMAQPELTITAINSPVQMSLSVTVPEYKIGKNPTMVDGAITYNPAISRVHCAITFNSGRYYITDLGSANGTYVNQNRLEKQQTVEIHSGDYIKLANSDFIVSF